MFWNEEAHRRATALAGLAQQQEGSNVQVSTYHAKLEPPPPVDWLIAYEREADARQKAWKTSTFYAAVEELFRYRGAIA